MDIHKILRELRDERVRLDKAIATLEALEGTTGPTAAKVASAPVLSKPEATEKTVVRNPMSAATKKRLSDLAKQRWAKKKKAKTA
ncbi:MAG: hypothetical protein WCE63_11080 [Acidobacteriaceae bacterium]